MFILSFLPLRFLSQSLVFVAVVFIVIIIWLLVSSSFHSWCYWYTYDKIQINIIMINNYARMHIIVLFTLSIYFSNDNSYLSMEYSYNNWVPLIDLTVSISIHPQEGSSERGTSIPLVFWWRKILIIWGRWINWSWVNLSYSSPNANFNALRLL